jgi:glutathione S-transferase
MSTDAKIETNGGESSASNTDVSKSPEEKDTYKLIYFNLRGIAEIIRVIFAIADVDYEDFRYPLTMPGYQRPEYDKDKKDGKIPGPYKALPLLVINGKDCIGQSKAIERFLAKRFNLMGSTDIECAQIEAVVDQIRDVISKFQACKAGGNGGPMKDKFYNVILPHFLNQFNAQIEETGGQFVVGKNMSLADLHLWNFLKFSILEEQSKVDEILKYLPKLNALVNIVNSDKRIKGWVERRPVTVM